MAIAPAIDFSSISSPHGNGHYKTAPSSPTRLTELYCGFDELFTGAGVTLRGSLTTAPFAWKEKPGVPKTPKNFFEDDFSFDVNCDFGFDSAPADDLFHGGVMKTVVTPPLVEEKKVERERGRERGFSSSSRLPSSRSRRTRSLSPLGISDYRREPQPPRTMSAKPPSTAACSSENGSNRWCFMDLLLFRSFSDGRAMAKDPLKKYTTIYRKNDQDFRKSSEPGSMSKRRGRVSAHELHYSRNRANSNVMKKRTYLPYKNGILGGLSFKPCLVHNFVEME